jgi:hypothetical protein
MVLGSIITIRTNYAINIGSELTITNMATVGICEVISDKCNECL